MATGAPLTVWRYLSFWLWRLVAITTAILVTVLAFAGAVKFLADGKLGPLDTIRFMLYAMPPMLQYALPFAGGFAATLTYHRFSADNEAVACRAGGISYHSLLVPALAAGLFLSGGLILLSNRIIPDFLLRMQAMVTEDATRIMVNTMKRGEAFEWDNDTLVYADEVDAIGPQPNSTAYQVLWLRGVLIVQLDKGDNAGKIKIEGSAHEAYVWFFRDSISGGSAGGVGAQERDATRITLVSSNFVGRATGVRTDVGELRLDVLVPNFVSGDPKFFGWRELQELRQFPERMPQVEVRRRKLATLLAEREAVRLMQSALRAEGRVRLVDAHDRPIVLRADRLELAEEPPVPGQPPPQRRHRIAAGTAGIAVEMLTDSGPRVRFTAPRAWLRSSWKPDAALDPVTFEIAMEEARSEGAAGAAAAVEHKQASRSGLKLVQDTLAPLNALSSRDLLAAADAYLASSPEDATLKNVRDELEFRIDDLMLEVFSKANERIAMAAACLVMVLTGGVMAMRLRDSLPLVVYLWSFFPALASVLTIVGGQQMVHEHGIIGLPVLWGGVGGLAAFTGAEFWRLRRF